MFSAWTAIVSGGILVFASFILKAKDNFESRVVFKVMPFVLGACLLFSAAQLFGWIVRL